MKDPTGTYGPAHAPTLRHIRVVSDRMAALARTLPCHTMIRPPRVRDGAVIDVAVPMDTTAIRAAREHYQLGGIVRLHARRPADLETAKLEIFQ